MRGVAQFSDDIQLLDRSQYTLHCRWRCVNKCLIWILSNFFVTGNQFAACRFDEIGIVSVKMFLKPDSTTRVHGQSSRAKLTARDLGCIFWHPNWQPELTGVKKCTRVDGPSTPVHFWQPSTRAVNSGVKKCTRGHGPSSRPVNSARELG